MAHVKPEVLEHYCRFWTDLTPDGVSGVGSVTTEDVRFRDPFNDVRGHAAFERILNHMFETTIDPRFSIRDTAIGENAAYLRWDMSFTPKSKLGQTTGQWSFTGMSELIFTPDGLVRAHIDHWDSGTQFYARFPLIGFLVRRVRSLASAK
ncbi:MAG: nuclear transport factor 2 family protein [Pseudomonadota bacterium]